jgi:hypothetical protein
MKIKYAFALLLLAQSNAETALRPPIIEDSLGGIIVGQSTLSDLKHRFGSRLTTDQEIYSVKWEGQCEISFFLEDEGPNGSQSRISKIALYNLGHGGSKGSPCESIQTGHGVRLSDSLQRIFGIYGKPTGHLPIGEYEAYGYDNIKNLCPPSSSPDKSVVIRDFGFDWSPKNKSIHSINLGSTNATCAELEDNGRSDQAFLHAFNSACPRPPAASGTAASPALCGPLKSAPR